MAFDECLELLINDGVTDIDGQLIEFVASDSVRSLLLDCDEHEPVDTGDALIPSGLNVVPELSDGLCEGVGRCVLGGLEVNDVITTHTIDAGFDLHTVPVVEIRDLGLDAIE